jgi:hypothetical protein
VSGASIATAASRPSRYHILYPRQNLKEFRNMLALMLVASVGIGGYYTVVLHKGVQEVYLFVIYGVFAVCFALAMYTYGLLSTVRFDEDGLSIRYGPFRRAHVEYADIDRGRLETVERIWERSGRRPTKMIRNLYKQRALCITLKGGEESVYDLRRRLGGRLVDDRELTLPITDVEDAMGALKEKLQQQRQAAAGTGAQRRNHRRGKRGRR